MHGSCPERLLEVVAYDDGPLLPPLHEEDDPVGELLDALQDEYVFDQGGTCLICEELVRQAGFAAFPGWKCEMSDCLVCEELGCNRCMDSGRVCRWCRRCDEHELETGADCERLRWSRVQLDHVTYFVHSHYDAATGRWSQ